MKLPGKTPGRRQSAGGQRWAWLGVWYGRQALAAFGAVAAAREQILYILNVSRSHTRNPPLTNLAHDVTEKVFEVGAWCFVFQKNIIHRLDDVLGLVTLEIKEVSWREAQFPKIIVPMLAAAFQRVSLCEIAAEMIRRFILRMEDWLSNAVRVKLRSLSGSPPSSLLSLLSALCHCFLPDVFSVAACSIKVSLIIRGRIKNIKLVKLHSDLPRRTRFWFWSGKFVITFFNLSHRRSPRLQLRLWQLQVESWNAERGALRMHGVPVGAAGRQGPVLRGVQVRGMPLCSQQCMQQVALWHPPGHPQTTMLEALAPSDRGLCPRRCSGRRARLRQRGQVLYNTIYHDICS